MAENVTFRPYTAKDREPCLAIFDANCPRFFAPNERRDYIQFLDTNPAGYEVCVVNEHIVGAFGLLGDGTRNRSLNWILIAPQSQTRGLGSLFLKRVIINAQAQDIGCICIAASHLSAPFFAKHGARVITETSHGWGPDMHRVDMELKL